MIAVDTSALMAILLDEPPVELCIKALEDASEIVISAGTLAEALIVAARRNVGEELAGLISGLGMEIATVDAASARRLCAVGQGGSSCRAQFRRLLRL
jgi:ribonuclease VapC